MSVMPTNFRLLQTRFAMQRFVQRTPLRGGGGLSIDYAPTRWLADFTTPTDLTRAEIDPIVAFVDGLRGGITRVEAFDWLRKWPRAHGTATTSLVRATGGIFDGTAPASSLAAHTAILSGLPAGFVLSAGDMVGLEVGGVRSLHRVGADVVASGLGVATVTVEPTIPIAKLAGPVTARLVAPTCIMVLVEDPEPSRTIGREGLSFKLAQVTV